MSKNNKYNLIIGNKPYISKKSINKEVRKLSVAITEYFELPEALFQNLWVSFILASVKMLKRNGGNFFCASF